MRIIWLIEWFCNGETETLLSICEFGIDAKKSVNKWRSKLSEHFVVKVETLLHCLIDIQRRVAGEPLLD